MGIYGEGTMPMGIWSRSCMWKHLEIQFSFNFFRGIGTYLFLVLTSYCYLQVWKLWCLFYPLERKFCIFQTHALCLHFHCRRGINNGSLRPIFCCLNQCYGCVTSLKEGSVIISSQLQNGIQTIVTLWLVIVMEEGQQWLWWVTKSSLIIC